MLSAVCAIFSPPDPDTTTYAGYHLAYEVKKLMYALAKLLTFLSEDQWRHGLPQKLETPLFRLTVAGLSSCLIFRSACW